MILNSSLKVALISSDTVPWCGNSFLGQQSIYGLHTGFCHVKEPANQAAFYYTRGRACCEWQMLLERKKRQWKKNLNGSRTFSSTLRGNWNNLRTNNYRCRAITFPVCSSRKVPGGTFMTLWTLSQVRSVWGQGVLPLHLLQQDLPLLNLLVHNIWGAWGKVNSCKMI